MAHPGGIRALAGSWHTPLRNLICGFRREPDHRRFRHGVPWGYLFWERRVTANLQPHAVSSRPCQRDFAHSLWGQRTGKMQEAETRSRSSGP